ncbi:MAG: bifunctional methylenetetrahydrofolate dehydrogenase/methenyltetrahydrofolate cyclohydrolase, partial [Rhodospirillales bacterium]|nr:bifunctional methylenetetrahydrofolate dehydrogenase/methenyltetrahydrofolate cyclohydrolase [Rhodospirillales bacterium]
MSAMIIDGKELARRTRARLAGDVADATGKFGSAPGLAAILVGDDPASETYVLTKRRQAAECGIRSTAHHLAADTTEADLIELVHALNSDDAVDAILVQLPLPRHIASHRVLDTVLPGKDVDGFHSRNAGLLAVGRPETVPCTPSGCLALLRQAHGDDESGGLGKLAGLQAVVVGRSSIVGRPMAALLTAENCTVTLAHSHTRNLPEVCRQADVLVAATGRPEMVRGDWIKPGATVID